MEAGRHRGREVRCQMSDVRPTRPGIRRLSVSLELDSGFVLGVIERVPPRDVPGRVADWRICRKMDLCTGAAGSGGRDRKKTRRPEIRSERLSRDLQRKEGHTVQECPWVVYRAGGRYARAGSVLEGVLRTGRLSGILEEGTWFFWGARAGAWKKRRFPWRLAESVVAPLALVCWRRWFNPAGANLCALSNVSWLSERHDIPER